MKKIILIITLTLIITFLVACQTTKNNKDSIPSAQAAEPTTKEVSTTPQTVQTVQSEQEVSSTPKENTEAPIKTTTSSSSLQTEPSSTPQLKEFSITAKQWEFSPSTITVNKGDTVRITIKSIDVSHGFHLPDFNINQQINPGKPVMVEFIADKTGNFPFSCSILCGKGHKGMTGELIVK